MKRKRPNGANDGRRKPGEPAVSCLSEEVLSRIFAFCDAADWMALRQTNRAFRKSCRLTVARAKSLNLSFLLKLWDGPRCRRKQSRSSIIKAQEECVLRLLIDDRLSCQRLELSGLQYVTGASGWLEHVLSSSSNPNLVSLDLSGCKHVNSRRFQDAIDSSSIATAHNVLHLNLQGCHRIGADAVLSISLKLTRLKTLLLGGCSQTIDGRCLRSICANLRQLHALGLDGLKRISDADSQALLTLPSTMECLTLSGCERIRMNFMNTLCSALRFRIDTELGGTGIHYLSHLIRSASMEAFRNYLNEGRFVIDLSSAFEGWRNLRVLHLDVGLPRSGLATGALGLMACFSFGALREVNISGCEAVSSLDILVLAGTCANTLTCLEMRACVGIRDSALKALAEHCTRLAYLDISACFHVTDNGLIELCKGCSPLRSLKVADLLLTDKAVLAIGGLVSERNCAYVASKSCGVKHLLLLDVRNCEQVTSRALGRLVSQCPLLVEIDARNTKDTNVYATVISSVTPSHSLRIINGRRCTSQSSCEATTNSNCCSAEHNSQRLKASHGVALQPMFHCMDCGLLPSCNRGVCSSCASVCHRGHRTYVGSLTRFYCDCAYGIGAGECCSLMPVDSI